MLSTPRVRRDQSTRSLTHLISQQQLTAPEELNFGQVNRRTLVGNRELGQPVDFVTPEVDAHRDIGGRRKNVDYRTPHRHLTTVFDLMFPAISEAHQPVDQIDRVDSVARTDDHRIDVIDAVTEPLHHRPDGCNHNLGSPRRIPQMPNRAQATTHRLDSGTHPLERERLPRRKQIDLVVAEKNPQVIGKTFCLVGCRHYNHQRRPVRQSHQARDGHGPSRFRNGKNRTGATENGRQGWFIMKKRGEIDERHRHMQGTRIGIYRQIPLDAPEPSRLVFAECLMPRWFGIPRNSNLSRHRQTSTFPRVGRFASRPSCLGKP